MTFQESIRTCFANYFTFSGRAARSEYWWFVLFIVVGSTVLALVSPLLNSLFLLATLVPSVSAAARRLHDTGRSGWWQLIVLVPVVGLIVLLVFLCQAGRDESPTASDLA